MINIDRIRYEEGTQARVEINEDRVKDYAEAIENGTQFPPVTLFHDGTSYWLADGWHRLLAHIRIGCISIHEEVKTGTKRDAWLYALGANHTHGLARTNADKRKAVMLAIQDDDLKILSNREIAKICNVNHGLVNDIRNELAKPTAKPKEKTQAKSKDKNGVEAPSTPAEPEFDPKQHELQEAKNAIKELAEKNQQLLDGVALAELPPDEQKTTAEIIDALRKENKVLTVTLDGVKAERDSLMREKVSMQNQMAMQRKQIEQLKGQISKAA